MKKKFSLSWKASKQVRKQRKYMFNMPLHLKRKLLAAGLSKELKKKHGKRNSPLRKGDTVKIMSGSFKGKRAKVLEINVLRSRVFLEGIQRTKKDGTKVNVPFNASKLQITEFNLDDRKRMKALQRTGKRMEVKESKQGGKKK